MIFIEAIILNIRNFEKLILLNKTDSFWRFFLIIYFYRKFFQELLVPGGNCKNTMFAETHGDMRLRASLLRKQVRHEGAKATSRPTQARRVRQETSRLPLL